MVGASMFSCEDSDSPGRVGLSRREHGFIRHKIQQRRARGAVLSCRSYATGGGRRSITEYNRGAAGRATGRVAESHMHFHALPDVELGDGR